MKDLQRIQQLTTALAVAQGTGDAHAESPLITELCNIMRPPKYSFAPMNFFSKICFGASECWYWRGARDPGGYGMMWHPTENKAHRVSWRMFRGDIPEGMKVLHRCDVRNCVNPDHLFLGTQQDNMDDMVAKGRSHTTGAKGEASGLAKLTNAKVLEMREVRRTQGTSYKRLAIQFGVSTMTAHRACTNKSWSHI